MDLLNKSATVNAEPSVQQSLSISSPGASAKSAKKGNSGQSKPKNSGNDKQDDDKSSEDSRTSHLQSHEGFQDQLIALYGDMQTGFGSRDKDFQDMAISSAERHASIEASITSLTNLVKNLAQDREIKSPKGSPIIGGSNDHQLEES